MNETVVPDCTDPDAPAAVERDVISKSSSISGAGVVANESFDTWDEWCESGGTKNIRIELGDRTWEGPAKLSELTIQGERGQRTNFTATIVSDGDIIRITP